jgi:initiation factor 1A
MVKNQIGGNKAKRQGRKFVGTTNSKLRLAVEEGEIYAVVTKHLGNAMIYVICIDGKSRLCIIRNKFRGRGKRDNCISVGNWVLVGAREWENEDSNNKIKCDLLEVYTLNDVEQLKKTPNNWQVLTSAIEKEDMKEDTSLIFTENISDDERCNDVVDNGGGTDEDDEDEGDEDDINFDDI